MGAVFILYRFSYIYYIPSFPSFLPPFPGECIYHTTKAAMEGFSNSLSNELCGTDIKVLVLRPGCVATHFHHQRVRYDDKQYEDFFEGYTPLIEDDIANTVSQVLSTPFNVSNFHRRCTDWLVITLRHKNNY